MKKLVIKNLLIRLNTDLENKVVLYDNVTRIFYKKILSKSYFRRILGCKFSLRYFFLKSFRFIAFFFSYNYFFRLKHNTLFSLLNSESLGCSGFLFKSSFVEDGLLKKNVYATGNLKTMVKTVDELKKIRIKKVIQEASDCVYETNDEIVTDLCISSFERTYMISDFLLEVVRFKEKPFFSQDIYIYLIANLRMFFFFSFAGFMFGIFQMFNFFSCLLNRIKS